MGHPGALGGASRGGPTDPAAAVRNLQLARVGFDLRDPEMSKAAHQSSLMGSNEEKHPLASAHIKSIVYGGLDGIITTFAVVAGAAGGGFGPNVVIVMGISSLLADALSMGVGDALSSKAETEVARRERERERWELENFKEGEIGEMVDIYTKRGMSKEDAEIVIRVCAKYEPLFVDMMLVDELGLGEEPKTDTHSRETHRPEKPRNAQTRNAPRVDTHARARARVRACLLSVRFGSVRFAAFRVCAFRGCACLSLVLHLARARRRASCRQRVARTLHTRVSQSPHPPWTCPASYKYRPSLLSLPL